MNYSMAEVMHKMDTQKIMTGKNNNSGLTMLDKMIINNIVDMDSKRIVHERYNESLNI